MKSDSLRIAVDFDETYTADPELFDLFIACAKAKGHDVRIVTYRTRGNDFDIDEVCAKLGIKALFTAGMQKRHYCMRLNWLPDIWIDDTPVNIPTQWEIEFKHEELKIE